MYRIQIFEIWPKLDQDVTGYRRRFRLEPKPDSVMAAALLCMLIICMISSLLILTAAVCGRRHPCRWRSDVHGCPLSATVRFRWPDAAFGTVCHPMSRQLQRSLFFGIASRHTSSQDHFLHNF